MKRQFSKDGGGDHTDIISSLPDTVLCHILSFLPTEKAVATSSLSKRWQYVWTYLTNLDFDDFNRNRKQVEVAGKMQFAQYVYGVLHLLRAPCIKTFCIWSNDIGVNEYDITSWLEVAIARNVELIDMCCYSVHYNLPMGLFNCNSLVKLKLHNATIKYIPDTQFFAGLKELYLYQTEFHDAECLKKFISGCSALEDLCLSGCEYLHCNSEILYISSLKLKRLDIHRTLVRSPEVKFVFNAPALEDLRIDEGESCELIAQDLSSVLKVYINICTTYMSNDDTCRRPFIKFIDSLYNVNSLCLTVAFEPPYASMPATMKSLFHNLTELNIGLTLDWGLLISLLENSNNLRSLSFEKAQGLYDQVKWIDPPHVPSCLSSCLKKVSVEGYEAEDLAMISYFLKNGKVLRIVRLTPLRSYSYKSRFNLLQKISLLPRKSEICSIEFSEDSFDYQTMGTGT